MGWHFPVPGTISIYRQGNLTWRLNTDTEQTCILFATDEEWKKAKVLSQWLWQTLGGKPVSHLWGFRHSPRSAPNQIPGALARRSRDGTPCLCFGIQNRHQ